MRKLLFVSINLKVLNLEWLLWLSGLTNTVLSDLWLNDIFGSCESRPCPDAITHLFLTTRLGRMGSFAVIGSDLDMSEANYKLMELNLEIRESLRTVQSYQLLAQAKPIGNLVSTGFWETSGIQEKTELKMIKNINKHLLWTLAVHDDFFWQHPQPQCN